MYLLKLKKMRLTEIRFIWVNCFFLQTASMYEKDLILNLNWWIDKISSILMISLIHLNTIPRSNNPKFKVPTKT